MHMSKNMIKRVREGANETGWIKGSTTTTDTYLKSQLGQARPLSASSASLGCSLISQRLKTVANSFLFEIA